MEDLTGKEFGRLKVIEYGYDKKYPSNTSTHYWKCQCSCENKTILYVSSGNLKRGHTTSCGCYRKEFLKEKHKKDFNEYEIINDVVKIYNDTKEEYTTIDLEDLEKIKQYRLYKLNTGYWGIIIKHNKQILLHRFLLNAPNNYEVDHIDRNPSNNTKKNLRLATSSQNSMNTKKPKNNTSGVKGVYYFKPLDKWKAQISFNNKSIVIGYYDDFDMAVQARKKAEDKYHGEYSLDNSIKQSEENNVKYN